LELNKEISDLNDFVHKMTEVVGRTKSDAEKVTLAEQLLGQLVQSDSWLPEEKGKPGETRYARHLLYHDSQDRFEVIALVWKPGQQTPLHDHDGTWGAEGVLLGRIKASNFLQADRLSNDIVKLHYTGTEIVNEQGTGQLLPPSDCHILEAEGDQIAITVHVYGKQLRKFRVFEPLEEEGLYSAREHHASYISN
jgi:predicted metal-dependent enzyme (double-stranded beta helix superfamily)